MRLFAEERRTGTLELLLTSPAREIDIVLAKFAAAMTVLLAMIGLTLTYALVTGVYGDLDWGPVYSGYLGLSLLARFTPFATGAMYTSDFGFFLALTLLGLFLTVRALARR
jgi:ABC-type transport system involved in multi-copper enzyme maturation permease subunit